jgi:hypothetical protein
LKLLYSELILSLYHMLNIVSNISSLKLKKSILKKCINKIILVDFLVSNDGIIAQEFNPPITERFFHQSGLFKIYPDTRYGIDSFLSLDLKINYICVKISPEHRERRK